MMQVTRTILCFFLLLNAISAQFDTAAVLGSVKDPSGAAVRGSVVTLVNVRTGVQQKATTNDDGNYQFLTVRAGDYTVSAEAPGFKTALADQFTVNVNARQRVDLALEVGAVSETVTVTDAAAALETDTSSRGTVVGTQQVVNLPLNGRAYADLALLAPGVRRSGIADSRDASFNVNGMRSSQNNFIVDGVDNNAYGTSNQGFSNQVVQITPDAMQEFRLETNNFSAEFGRAGGAVINASIRSGGNQFHGSAWEYLRNTVLNATGFFKPVNNVKPSLVQNQFGGAVGGPIVKEKMFFFADYEGFRRVSRQITFATLPTMEQRAGNLGIAVRNPLTGELFSNGQVPQSSMTQFARDVLAGLPATNRTGVANNFESQPRREDRTDKGDIRYDQYFNSKLTAFVRYSHRLLENFEPPAIPGPSGGDSNGNVRVLNQQIAFGSTYTVSPTSLIEFRMGVSLTEGGKLPLFVGTEGVGQRYGFPNVPTDPRFTGGLYRQGINGFTALGVQSSNPQFQNPFVVNPKVNYSKLLNRHSLKMGYEFQSIDTAIDDFNPKYGSDTYAGRFSQAPGTATNNAQFLADFMFGARSRYSLNNAVIMDYRQRMHFLYLQDDWKATDKLTLNLGVRYEYATPQFEAENRISNYNPTTGLLDIASAGSLYERALVEPDRDNWAPRIGLAWTFMPKTVLRAAYGISFIHFNRMGGENILAYNLPHVLNPTIDQIAPAAGGLPLCTSTSQAPLSCFRPTQGGYPDNFLSVNNINQLAVRTNHIPQDFKTSYTQSWHLTLQRELPASFVLDLGYVGTRGVGLMILGDLNQARPNNVGENASLQSRRPISNFGYIQSAFGAGFLTYHAFQTKVERRFANGIYFLNSFTWSKAIDNASGHLEAQNGDNSRVNYRNLPAERGLSGYDQPFVNVTTLLYDLPFGRGKRFGASMPKAADLAFGGWRLSVINFAQSGTTVNLSYSPASAFQVSGAPTYRPNITGDPLLPDDQRTETRWLNPATVVIPTDVTRPFGNAGRNIVRGPRLDAMNFGLHKDFNFTESQKLEFRMEAFNFLNKTNFDNPVGNRSANNFGTINSTQAARQIQFALRYAF